MNSDTQTSAPKAPDPTEGGRYNRETDGSLTLIHQTKPTPGRRDHLQPKPEGEAAADTTGDTGTGSGAGSQPTAFGTDHQE